MVMAMLTDIAGAKVNRASVGIQMSRRWLSGEERGLTKGLAVNA